MTEPRPFQPKWVSPPGDTLADLLEERGWSQAEFADRADFSRKHVNDLLKGRASITPETASRLAMVLGSTEQFWLTREARYRAALATRAHISALSAQSSWLAELPLPWLVKQGWVRRLRDRGEQVEACLRYFSVASVEAWRAHYEAPQAAFRASPKFVRHPGAVAAWLRRAEIEAGAIDCAPYDAQAFRALCPTLRTLSTLTDLHSIQSALRSRCAAVGVAVVVVPAPPKCPVSGATRWLTPNKAMLVLSLRHKTDDHLWFTFFHEAAHLLLHEKKLVFVDGVDGLDDAQEAEADKFARDTLISEADARSLAMLRTAQQVKRRAKEMGIAPGILVGRMQHDGAHPWQSALNALKIRYADVDAALESPKAEHTTPG